MQQFMKLKEQRARALSDHPFMQWLSDDNVPIERKLLFAPIMMVFVMNFRDMNRWVIRFDESDNKFKDILNGNTFEDETHSRWFLEDWRALDLDRIMRWQTSDVLWWLFLADQNEPFRRYSVEFIRLCIEDKGEPLLRFSHSEAGEACGHTFFKHVVEPTADLSERTGRFYRYFGRYHLDRELGHVIESEGVFEKETLTPEQRQQALGLGNHMFDIFSGIFDAFHDYTQNHVVNWNPPRRTDAIPAAPPPRNGPRYRAIPGIPARGHERLVRLLDERKRRTAAHPFFTWLRATKSVPAMTRLQRFMPMWAMDILGYGDLNHHVMRYEHPQNDRERAINHWVADLQTHKSLYLTDWDALAMDDALGWTASETMEFLFLDRYMDIHRRNIIRFNQLGLEHRDPVLRYWMMHALESSGEAFFENTRVLALEVERAHGCRLNYLGDRHELAHPSADVTHEVQVEFMDDPLSADEQDIVATMINTVFDAVDEQFSMSLDVAANDRFHIDATDAAEHAPPRSAASRRDQPVKAAVAI